MKLLVLHNTKSGRAKFLNHAKIVRYKVDRLNINYVYIDIQEGSYFDLQKTVKEKNITHVLIMGGDGTVRSVCEHVIKYNINIDIGIYPTGSGNVMAKILGVTRNLEYLKAPKIKKIFPSIVNDKYYFFIAFCLGTIADVVTKAHYLYKDKIGFLSYLISGALHLNRKEIYQIIETYPRFYKWEGQCFHFFTRIVTENFMINFNNNRTNISKNTVAIRYLSSGILGYIKLVLRLIKGRFDNIELSISDRFDFEKTENISANIDGENILIKDRKITILKSKIPIRFMR